MNPRSAPGPDGGTAGLEHYRRFLDDPLGFVTAIARDYDGFALVRFGWIPVYFVSRPDVIREVLVTKRESFPKLRRQMRALGKVEGESVNTADGEAWKRHRAFVQPAFQTRHFAGYVDAVVGCVLRRIDGWPPGGTIDAVTEMDRLALEIIGRLLFDADWSGRAGEIRESVRVFRESMQAEVGGGASAADGAERAIRELDALVREGMAGRRRSPGAGDMFSLLLAAAGPDGLPPEPEVRDDAATLFMAGHDTTSAALAWLWTLLGRHTEVAERAAAEVDEALGGRAARYEDLRRLAYLETVVKESLRLYPPPAFLFGREAGEDAELAGCAVRQGSWVLVSPYAAHRDPKLFPDPEAFDPGRFAPGRVESIPPYAYIPFGAGPRTCAANVLATAELMAVAATVLQRFRVELEPGHPEVTPKVEVVLRPRGSVQLRVRPRR